MSDDDAIVKEFLVESYENLDRLDQILSFSRKTRPIAIPWPASSAPSTRSKGHPDFSPLTVSKHWLTLEKTCWRLRDGILPLNPEITTALLAMVDVVRDILKNIEETGKEGDRQDEELIARLSAVLETGSVAATPPPKPAEPVPSPDPAPQPAPNLGEILIQRGAAKSTDVQAHFRRWAAASRTPGHP